MSSVKENGVLNTIDDLARHFKYYKDIGENELVESWFTDKEAARFVRRCHTAAANVRTKFGTGVKYGVRQIICSPSITLTERQEQRMLELIRIYRKIPADVPILVSKHTKRRSTGDDAPHYHIGVPYVFGSKVFDDRNMYVTTHAIARHLEIELGEKRQSSRYCKQVAKMMREHGFIKHAELVEQKLKKRDFKIEPRPTTGTYQAAASEGLDLRAFKAEVQAVLSEDPLEFAEAVRDVLAKHRCHVEYTQAKNGVTTLMLFAGDRSNPIGSFRRITGVKTSKIDSIIAYVALMNNWSQNNSELNETPQNNPRYEPE